MQGVTYNCTQDLASRVREICEAAGLQTRVVPGPGRRRVEASNCFRVKRGRAHVTVLLGHGHAPRFNDSDPDSAHFDMLIPKTLADYCGRPGRHVELGKDIEQILFAQAQGKMTAFSTPIRDWYRSR